ncbi:MAG: aminoacyl-tRNA hydrolase [Acidobacteria bacterium]|nr:aminoacyl-tRNA hydrolase [Acidobacteriota bacterium]
MRLIVGLGNPDPEYQGTPHNLGFDVVERLASQARIRTRSQQGRARLWRGRLDQEEVLLAQPLTYMNLSGAAVGELLRAHGLTATDLVVILDDVALPFGQLRIRERGSAGGHRGLESVLAAVGTDEVARVRLGIQPLDAQVGDLADYVLAPMDDEQRHAAERMVAEAAAAVRVLLREGAQKAMARFNRRSDAADAETEIR